MRLPKIWPAAASALLILAACPPFRLSLVVFVALVPWLLYLRECDGKRALRSGLLFGFLFWLGELSFIAIFVGKWTQSWALGLLPYLPGCAIASVYFALFGWLGAICFRRGIPWAIPIAWAGVEVLRSYIVGLAFPFGLLAMPLTPFPAIIQSAHFGTVYLTSAWVMLANVIFADLMLGKKYLQVRWYGLAFFALLALSVSRYMTEPEGELRTLAAGQPGVDMAFTGSGDPLPKVASAAEQLEFYAKGADLLVLPEGIVRSGTNLPPDVPFPVDPSLPVVFGGQRGVDPAHQSAFGFDGTWSVADKTRLVIFGEYVPFRDLPFMQSFRLPAGDLVPGDKVTTLKVGKFKVGGALCFEALFPDIAYKHALNGANVLAVMSIDDWYFGTNAPEQLRDASNWRAIEMGVPVARAASLGYTTIVDARGRTVAQIPLGGLEVARARVNVPEKADLFPLLPVFPYFSLLSLAAIPVYDVIRRRKSRNH